MVRSRLKKNLDTQNEKHTLSRIKLNQQPLQAEVSFAKKKIAICLLVFSEGRGQLFVRPFTFEHLYGQTHSILLTDPTINLPRIRLPTESRTHIPGTSSPTSAATARMPDAKASRGSKASRGPLSPWVQIGRSWRSTIEDPSLTGAGEKNFLGFIQCMQRNRLTHPPTFSEI